MSGLNLPACSRADGRSGSPSWAIRSGVTVTGGHVCPRASFLLRTKHLGVVSDSGGPSGSKVAALVLLFTNRSLQVTEAVPRL